jgi:HrpA-like RNA helicase
LILHEAGYTATKTVGITQPRRIATLSVSDFIRRQLDSKDAFVGYKMRFSDTTDRETRIKVMTDGILLMELKADPLLSAYSVMLVDEAHERSLNIDFVLGLLKNVLAARPEFKVIVSSATINTSVFSRYFDDAPVISIDARIHPVDIIYKPVMNAENSLEVIDSVIAIVEQRAQAKAGDILVFLPGEFDIKTCVQQLTTSKIRKDLVVYPLFGRLSKEEQERVFHPTPKGKTKVVVSTNIAETSVTIDGITTVIDSGIAKINYYNQKNFTSSLVSLPIARSSCEQRAGRAGRTAPGVCYRLYDKNDFETRYTYGTEEILRTDLSEVVLRMSELGIYDYERFSFITRPKSSAITSAEETLRFIQAIDSDRHLTSIGELMVKFPLLPRHSRVIVEAMMRYPDVIQEVIIAISFLSCKTPFMLPPGQEDAARKAHQSFSSEHGDFISFLDIYHQFTSRGTVEEREKFCKNLFLDYPSMAEIHHVADQLAEIVSEIGVPIGHGGSIRNYLCCLAAGLLQFVCVKAKKNMYKSLTADQIYIHPGSAWFKEMPQFILAGEIVQTSRMYARSVSPLKKEWIDSISTDLRLQLSDMKNIEPGMERKERLKRRDDRVQEDRIEKAEISRQESRARKVKIASEQPSPATNTMLVYGRQYPLEAERKGSKSVVIIPLEDLPYLHAQNLTAPRRPRNFPATLVFQDLHIHHGEKFFSLLELNGKVQPEKGILGEAPLGNFESTDPKSLVDNLDWILAFCRMKKDKKKLGFIQLDYVGEGLFRFSAVKNCFEALDSSVYALGQLVDEIDAQAYPQEMRLAKKAFERLLRSFDS